MPVPDDVREFLSERIETFEQLESLLLLASDRDRKWSVEDIATATKMRKAAVAAALDELSEKELVEEYAGEGVAHYRLSPVSADVEATVERTRQAYEEHAVDVMKLMSKNAMERLRTAAIRTFSEAFVLRRKKDG